MSDAELMLRCVTLARQAEGRTAPNPMVGALIVRDGEVIAEGWHVAPGRDHAEVAALRKLGGRAEGATMVVNLEPCCHHGRTPPCTDALLASGIRRVLVGMVDPNPIVAGKGLTALREAGIEVEVGIEEAACRRLNAGYILALEARRPFVLAKAAVTLDGRIADEWGHSQWISGELSREQAHALRDRCDAVLVGVGTALADDPSLNTRIPGGRDALPVVLDRQLRLPDTAKLLRAGRRPLLFCGPEAPSRELPADIVRVGLGPGGLDLREVLTALVARGVHTLLVEGGATVLRSFLEQDLVDELQLFVAPKVLGGGPSWLGGPGRPIERPFDLQVRETRLLGQDLHVTLERL